MILCNSLPEGYNMLRFYLLSTPHLKTTHTHDWLLQHPAQVFLLLFIVTGNDHRHLTKWVGLHGNLKVRRGSLERADATTDLTGCAAMQPWPEYRSSRRRAVPWWVHCQQRRGPVHRVGSVCERWWDPAPMLSLWSPMDTKISTSPSGLTWISQYTDWMPKNDVT